MPKNIIYQSDAISAFYRAHRRKWSDFYPSEQTIFEALAAQGASFATVLDVGCAAGGLGEALMERFGSIASYTGIDLNCQVIDVAKTLPTRIRRRQFVRGDICADGLQGNDFDLVTALGVADWNVDASGILAKCWERVRPGGYLIASLRLTPGAGVCDISRSFQYIWFEDKPAPADAERAAYNVFNSTEAIRWLKGQTPHPSEIRIYGYWGKPSATARTPYDRLVFSVIAMRKPPVGSGMQEPVLHIDLPSDAFAAAI